MIPPKLFFGCPWPCLQVFLEGPTRRIQSEVVGNFIPRLSGQFKAAVYNRAHTGASPALPAGTETCSTAATLVIGVTYGAASSSKMEGWIPPWRLAGGGSAGVSAATPRRRRPWRISFHHLSAH